MTMRTLLAALLAWSTVALGAPQVGQSAPDFTVADSSGQAVHLADLRGKLVVLEWTNHECPFVRKHYDSGNMQTLQKDATAAGAVWLTVVSSAPGKQGHVDARQADQLTRGRHAAPSRVLLDAAGTVGHAYDAKTTPHMFIVDPKGTLVYMGGIDSIASTDADDLTKARPYVKTALAETLAGKPVSEPVTRPYGCSIKY
jgi:peroxiredoxin